MTDPEDKSTSNMFPGHKAEITPKTHNVLIRILKSKDGIIFTDSYNDPMHELYSGDCEILSSAKITMTEGEFIEENEQKS